VLFRSADTPSVFAIAVVLSSLSAGGCAGPLSIAIDYTSSRIAPTTSMEEATEDTTFSASPLERTIF